MTENSALLLKGELSLQRLQNLAQKQLIQDRKKLEADERKEKVLEILGSDFAQLAKLDDGVVDPSKSKIEFENKVIGNATEKSSDLETSAKNSSKAANASSPTVSNATDANGNPIENTAPVTNTSSNNDFAKSMNGVKEVEN